MFRVLSNQHYQYRTNQKLRSWASAVFQNRGVCGQAVPSFSSPSPVLSLFLLSSQLSRRTREETLATQATVSSTRLFGLGSKSYRSNTQRMLNKEVSRFLQRSRVSQNRASERETQLAGCGQSNKDPKYCLMIFSKIQLVVYY